MIKCPETLKAGPYSYKVGRDKGSEDFGRAQLVKREVIFGNANFKSNEALVTLVHEWLHVAEDLVTVEGSEQRMKHDSLNLVATAVVDLLQQLGIDTQLDVSELPELRL